MIAHALSIVATVASAAGLLYIVSDPTPTTTTVAAGILAGACFIASFVAYGRTYR